MNSRRQALKTFAFTGTGFPILPAALRGEGAPSKRVNLAMTGTGRQGMEVNLKTFPGMPNFKVVAVCGADRLQSPDPRLRGGLPLSQRPSIPSKHGSKVIAGLPAPFASAARMKHTGTSGRPGRIHGGRPGAIPPYYRIDGSSGAPLP
jgi:hypothetical protein